MAEIPLYALEEAVNDLLDLLAEHGIAVDFMGEWDDLAAYRFITEELLDEEMDDIRIEGMFSVFEATTPEYDVQMWVDIFVTDLSFACIPVPTTAGTLCRLPCWMIYSLRCVSQQ